MRGDFLGEASLAWQDLEIGREVELTLVQRTGVKGGSVKGAIKLLVGEAVTEVVSEEQASDLDAVVDTAADEQSAGSVMMEKEVGIVWGMAERVAGVGL